MAAPATVAAPARVTLAQFQEMDLDDHAELILGRILEPMPESLRHLKAAWRLARLMETLFPDVWVVRDASLPIQGDGMPRPDLLVLDEPSSGLDPVVRRDILAAIIRTIAEEGRTVLFSSHLLDEVERVSDHVAMIRDGRIAFSGGMDEIKREHANATLDEILLAKVGRGEGT